jgi:xanthine dehydrogenase YagS FAD-binding subunit
MLTVQYYQPTSWKDASAAIAANPNARAIAGGSDLLDWMKDDITGPAEPRWQALIDLRAVPQSDAIAVDSSGNLTLGALAPLSKIAGSADVQQHFPLLAQAAAAVASPNIRNVGTIGGNLNQRPRCWYLRNVEFDRCYRKGGDFCYAVTGQNEFHCILGGQECYIVHPSDTAPALMALGAEAVVQAADGSTKTVKLDDYFITPNVDVTRENILTHGDLLTEIHVPAPAAGTKMAFIKARERGDSYDFALANVATVLVVDNGTVSSASVVLSGVAPTPHRATETEQALAGKQVDAALAKSAAQAALVGARPMTDNAYKVDLAETLIRRSIMQALAA